MKRRGYSGRAASTEPVRPESKGADVAGMNYCGCCGNKIKWGEWCGPCRKHVLPVKNVAVAPWDRTFFAQHGVDCPVPLMSADIQPREDGGSPVR